MYARGGTYLHVCTVSFHQLRVHFHGCSYSTQLLRTYIYILYQVSQSPMANLSLVRHCPDIAKRIKVPVYKLTEQDVRLRCFRHAVQVQIEQGRGGDSTGLEAAEAASYQSMNGLPDDFIKPSCSPEHDCIMGSWLTLVINPIVPRIENNHSTHVGISKYKATPYASSHIPSQGSTIT